MVTLRADRPSDLLAVRFASSPLWETMHAVRTYAHRASPHQRPWLRAVSPAASRLNLRPLLAISPRRGYTPDFLTPPPSGASPRFADQLAQVRRTPPEQVLDELKRCRQETTEAADAREIDALMADPVAGLARLADLTSEAWTALVEPYWPKVRELLRSDIAHRSHQLAERGLGHVLDHLDDSVRWTGSAIVVDASGPDVVEPDPRGIILMPSAFTWPRVVVITDRPWQPTIVYPVRGIGRLWGDPQPPSESLARLIGRVRAAILTALDEPASTTSLAVRLDISPSGASRHLIVLRDSGLLTATRHRHEVRYRRTRLGTALVRSTSSRERAPNR